MGIAQDAALLRINNPVSKNDIDDVTKDYIKDEQRRRQLIAVINETLEDLRRLKGVTKVQSDPPMIQLKGKTYTLHLFVTERGLINDQLTIDHDNCNGDESLINGHYQIRWLDEDGTEYGGYTDPEKFQVAFGDFVGRRLATRI